MAKIKLGFFTTTIDNRKAAGTALYARKTVEYLKRRNEDIDLYCIHYKFPDKDNIYENTKEIFIPEIKLPFRGSRFLSEFLFMLAGRYDFDILHLPHQRVYPGFIFSSAKKRVVTIHDAGSKIFKLPSRLNRFIFDSTIEFLQFKIDAVITVSEFSKQEINKHYHIPNEKIYVNYHGIEKNFQPLNLSDEEILRFRQKYNIYGKYLLDVSRIQPHKNIRNLILAYSQLKEITDEYKLVIVGGFHWRGEEIKELINNLKLNDKVLIIDYIEDEDMPILYNLAEMLVFPSLHEGFGFPIIEAFACGCPVITSNITAMPEIAGRAALIIDPERPEEIAGAIRKILFDSKLRQELVSRGLERAKEFNWEKSIDRLVKIYKQALSI